MLYICHVIHLPLHQNSVIEFFANLLRRRTILYFGSCFLHLEVEGLFHCIVIREDKSLQDEANADNVEHDMPLTNKENWSQANDGLVYLAY